MDHPNTYNSRNSNSNLQSVLLPLLLLLLAQQPQRRLLRPRMPSNRSWNGPEVVNNILNCESIPRIYTQLRMHLNTFIQLRDWLVIHTQLRGSLHISIEEKLLIFIYIASTSSSNRAAQERFNRSARIVSLYV